MISEKELNQALSGAEVGKKFRCTPSPQATPVTIRTVLALNKAGVIQMSLTDSLDLFFAINGQSQRSEIEITIGRNFLLFGQQYFNLTLCGWLDKIEPVIG